MPNSGIIYVDRRTGEVLEKPTRANAGHINEMLMNYEPSMVNEADAEEADINNVIARFHRTGHLPHVHREPQYGDVTGLQGDLTERFVQARAFTEETGKRFSEHQAAQEQQKAAEAAEAAKPAQVAETPPAEE